MPSANNVPLYANNITVRKRTVSRLSIMRTNVSTVLRHKKLVLVIFRLINLATSTVILGLFKNIQVHYSFSLL
jgi:hypothetical protein